MFVGQNQHHSWKKIDRFLHRWIDAVDTAPPATRISELGATGRLLFADVSSDEVPGEERSTYRAIRRVLDATVPGPGEDGYRRREDLRADITALLAVRGIPRSRQPLFDRLDAALRDAAAGSGRAILIRGVSGVGKTHLWRSALRNATVEIGALAEFKALQSGVPPYAGYAAILDGLLAAAPSGPADGGPPPLDRLLEDDPRFQRLARFVRSLLPLRYGNERVVTAGAIPDLSASLADLIRALAAELPRKDTPAAVVLVIDDAQWLDSQSREIIDHLARDPTNLLLAVLARPGDEGFDSSGAGEGRLDVGPLTGDEVRLLARAFAVPVARGNTEEALRSIEMTAGGNPFRIQQMARQLADIDRLADQPSMDPGGEPPRTVLPSLSPAAASMLELAALLLPPVSGAELIRAYKEDQTAAVAALSECIDGGVLIQRDGLVSFTHDQLETAARTAGLYRDETVRAAGVVLRERVLSGESRSSYTFARLVAGRARGVPDDEGIMPVEEFLDRSEVATVLADAAERALELMIPGDALRFATVAVERSGGFSGIAAAGDVAASDGRLSRLALIGHRAAFLLDDPDGMSRFYRLVARFGDLPGRVEARLQWMSRSYAKLWINGAVQIGWKTLQELGAFDRLARIDPATWLRRHRPGRVAGKLSVAPSDDNERRRLIARTCAALLLPAMSAQPERAAMLAVIILDQALESGVTPHTPFGFLYWAIDGESRGAPPVHVAEVARRGAEILPSTIGLEDDPVEAHRIRTFVSIVTLPWLRLTPQDFAPFFQLYREGMRLGSFEAACHAIHVFCYAPLFHGYPLRDVFSTIEHYRGSVESLGLARVSRAMGKFSQTALTLMGKTADPRRISGAICDEDELEAELTRTRDTLGLAGLRFLRLLLAVFHDTPEAARTAAEATRNRIPLAAFLIDSSLLWFFRGISAARCGDRREAAAMRRLLRTVADTPPGSFRYRALLGQRTFARGKVRRGSRMSRDAADAALVAGHFHDAALIAEVHADHLVDAGKDAEAFERLVVARDLYHRWGCTRKVQELDGRIDAFRRHRGLVLAGTVDSTSLPDETYGDPPGETTVTLREVRDSANLLFAYVDEALFLTDDQGRVIFHNVVAESYLQESVGGLIVPPDLWAALAGRREGGVPEDPSPISGVTGRRDGELTWNDNVLQYTIQTVSSGPNSRRAVMLRDITEDRRRDRRLIVADRLSSLGMMAATVAHEIGNPNHIVSLNAQTIAAGTTEPTVQEAVAGILEGTSRINDVVALITRYARDGRAPALQKIDPAEIAARVDRFTRIMVREFARPMHLEVEPNLPLIPGYPALLEQGLINLIRNACEALPERSRRIVLRAFRDGEALRFEVCDEGTGFPSSSGESVGPIPEVFETGRPGSGGTGLGIAIVRTIVEQHGGSFGYRRDAEFTTIASISIPIAGPPSETPQDEP